MAAPKFVPSSAEVTTILNSLSTQRDVYLRAARAEKDPQVAELRQKAADGVSVLIGKISTGSLEI